MVNPKSSLLVLQAATFHANESARPPVSHPCAPADRRRQGPWARRARGGRLKRGTWAPRGFGVQCSPHCPRRPRTAACDRPSSRCRGARRRGSGTLHPTGPADGLRRRCCSAWRGWQQNSKSDDVGNEERSISGVRRPRPRGAKTWKRGRGDPRSTIADGWPTKWAGVFRVADRAGQVFLVHEPSTPSAGVGRPASGNPIVAASMVEMVFLSPL